MYTYTLKPLIFPSKSYPLPKFTPNPQLEVSSMSQASPFLPKVLNLTPNEWSPSTVII